MHRQDNLQLIVLPPFREFLQEGLEKAIDEIETVNALC
jgi:hypothetical protein